MKKNTQKTAVATHCWYISKYKVTMKIRGENQFIKFVHVTYSWNTANLSSNTNQSINDEIGVLSITT